MPRMARTADRAARTGRASYSKPGGLSDQAWVDEGVTSGGDNNQWDNQACKPTPPDQPCPETAPPTDKEQ